MTTLIELQECPKHHLPIEYYIEEDEEDEGDEGL